MKFSVVLLGVNGCLFVAFGLGFMLIPETLAAFLTGAAPETPSAVTDMRATYGGMALGLGVMFGLCARDPRYLRLGVEGIVGVMAALALARLVGMVLDGSPNVFMFVLLGAELAMAGMAVAALRQVRDQEPVYTHGPPSR